MRLTGRKDATRAVLCVASFVMMQMTVEPTYGQSAHTMKI